MAELNLKNIRKTYGKSIVAVKDFTLDINDREFLVIVGPSGCGKSTILRLIAGLETPDSGSITLNGKVINDTPVQKRNMAMVFQHYALYETMTVFENLAFPLRILKKKKADIEKRVTETAALLGISTHLNRYPRELSGGEKQRTAIGRALIKKPEIFLMDEPLSNLDTQLKLQLREEIAALHQRLKATTIYVTHDQTEAMTLADRIAVMKEGEIIQCGTPEEIYQKPVNPFVAGFFGNPPINFFEQNGKIYGVRPEDILLSDHSEGELWTAAEVERCELLGAQRIYYVNTVGEKYIISTPAEKIVSFLYTINS